MLLEWDVKQLQRVIYVPVSTFWLCIGQRLKYDTVYKSAKIFCIANLLFHFDICGAKATKCCEISILLHTKKTTVDWSWIIAVGVIIHLLSTLPTQIYSELHCFLVFFFYFYNMVLIACVKLDVSLMKFVFVNLIICIVPQQTKVLSRHFSHRAGRDHTLKFNFKEYDIPHEQALGDNGKEKGKNGTFFRP